MDLTEKEFLENGKLQSNSSSASTVTTSLACAKAGFLDCSLHGAHGFANKGTLRVSDPADSIERGITFLAIRFTSNIDLGRREIEKYIIRLIDGTLSDFNKKLRADDIRRS
jgi:hypothetical protein